MLSKEKFRKSIKTFERNENGDIAILFGVMTVVLVMIIGAAVDFSRWLHARNQTISAMDTAVLAGGRSLQVDPTDQDGAIAAAQAFYTHNTQSRFLLVNDTIGFEVGDDGQSIVAVGNAYITTPFLGVANIHLLPILDEAGAEHPKSEVGVGGKSKRNIELALMLDVTSSMEGNKLADLKTAAKDLITIVVEDDQSQSKSRVSLVPVSEGVRLPTSSLDQATGTRTDSFFKTENYLHPYFGLTTITRAYYVTACVAERLGQDAYTDAAPGSGNFVQAIYTSNVSRACLPTVTNELVALSDDKPTLINAVDQLSPGGQGAIHIGIAWSWYTLSPHWNSIWSSSDHHAANYAADNTQKIAVFMTDGAFDTQYSDQGIAVEESEAALGASTTQISALCSGMKQAGVVIYVVGFDLDAAAESTLTQCASDPSKVFTAANGEELKQAFRAVGLEISKIYLSS